MYSSLVFSFFSPLQSLPESHSCDLSLVLNLKLHFQAMRVVRMQLGHGSPERRQRLGDHFSPDTPYTPRGVWTQIPRAHQTGTRPPQTPRGAFQLFRGGRKRGSPQPSRTVSQPPAHRRPQPPLRRHRSCRRRARRGEPALRGGTAALAVPGADGNDRDGGCLAFPHGTPRLRVLTRFPDANRSHRGLRQKTPAVG